MMYRYLWPIFKLVNSLLHSGLTATPDACNEKNLNVFKCAFYCAVTLQYILLNPFEFERVENNAMG